MIHSTSDGKQVGRFDTADCSPMDLFWSVDSKETFPLNQRLTRVFGNINFGKLDDTIGPAIITFMFAFCLRI